jgi:transcription initiation factor TFIID subunit 1
MSNSAATTPLDFASLLSKNYRPARASRLIPREAYTEQEIVDKADKKKDAISKEERAAARDAEASKLVMQLVSKTPTYNRHVKKSEQSEADAMNGDRLPKAPMHEWETLPSALHAVELDDWENKIQWDGIKEESTPGPINKVDVASLLGQRRNPYLDALVFDDSNISWEGAKEDTMEKARRVNLILEMGTAGQSIARSLVPVSRPTPFGQSEAYLQRYEREWLTPAISSAELGKGMLHADRQQMEAFVEARQKKREQMAIDKSVRVQEAMGTLSLGGGKGRTVTSSLMGPGGTERTGRPSRLVGSGLVHDTEYVEQLEMIYNHELIKPELSRIQLRQFHRPRLPLCVVRNDSPWQFQIRYLPSTKKADSNATNASFQALIGSHAGALSQTNIRNEADLSPTEGNLILLEYSEERPLIQLTRGMASKIVNYYRGDRSRCPVSAGGGDRPIRKKRQGGTSANANEAAQSGKTGRSTRLFGPNEAAGTTVIDWIGKPPKKTREERTEKSAIDVLPEGVTEILYHKVHGPFIGEVEEGETQTGLISNMFVAPMFQHEPESTDFLMILGKKPSSGSALDGPPQPLGVVLRPFPSSVFTVGQTEPRIKVFPPNSAGEKAFTTPFHCYLIAKALTETERHEGHGLRFDEIYDYIFPYTQHQQATLRQRLKPVAIYDKPNGIHAVKRVGMDDYPGYDVLARRFTPESVAAYRTTCAASRRLADLGIHELSSGTSNVAGVGVAMAYLAGQVNGARELSRKMKKMLEFAKTSKSNKNSQIVLYEMAADRLETAWKEARRRHEVARFIYEELQLAPWHLTQEFIDVHRGGQGTGMMKLTGIGDPTGRGEGFNFLREEVKSNKATGNTDGALNAQIKKITGTENDLRRLTMKQMASLLKSYGMSDKDIKTLKRWDRVHVIRDLSTKAACDGMGDSLERFARGEKMKLSDQKQMYQQRIQEIWRRQRAALSNDAGESRAPGGDAAGTAASIETEPKPDSADKLKLSKEVIKDKEESDSESDDDDDDLAAMLEEDLMDVRETNQLVAAHVRGSGDDMIGNLGQKLSGAQDLNKDARELAALKRQREEERQTMEGLLSGGGKTVPKDRTLSTVGYDQSMIGKKVIRKRITKTHADGRQTTTFKFVVGVPDEIEKVIARKREEEDGPDKKPRKHKEHKSADKPIGHAMFEEEDNHPSHRSSRGGIKMQVSRQPRTMKGGASSRMHKHKPKLGKLKHRESQEMRMHKRKRADEEADLYVVASKRMSTNNRRERGSARERMPHVILADKLESIRSAVEKRTGSGPFHKPVPRRSFPRYYEVISNPIDLQTIRDKNQRYVHLHVLGLHRPHSLNMLSFSF